MIIIPGGEPEKGKGDDGRGATPRRLPARLATRTKASLSAAAADLKTHRNGTKRGSSSCHQPFTIDSAARYPTQAFFKNAVLGEPTNACIEWPFGVCKDGYGKIRYGGRNVRASRMVCELAHGAPPSDGLEAAHSCNNRPCINPAHLSWKTSKENSADQVPSGTVARQYGEANGQARITAEDVKQIRALGGKVSQRALARQFNVAPATVWDILHYRNWRHVP